MHPNAEKIREMNRLLAAGDMDGAGTIVAAIYDENVVTHVPGRSALAGDLHGLSAFLESFQKVMTRTGGTYSQDLHAVLADDEHSCELYERTAEVDGVVHQWKAVDISNWKDGKIVEQWLIPLDPYQLDEIFS
ncbi:MAG: nuclear transport factor 2 family protein [Acidimicrobiia bacterium]|nr:nuclear transport factor 2 family protein [Acidimicrobiia bacterium]